MLSQLPDCSSFFCCLRVALRLALALAFAANRLGVNSIALLKSQTFQQSFYSSVGHPVVLETLLKSLLKSLLRFQQSY